MEVKAYYTAYKKRIFLGVLTEYKNQVGFKYNNEFDVNNINILPTHSNISSIFWDFLPSGYNQELLGKMGLSNIPRLKNFTLCSKRAVGAIEFEPSIPVNLEEKQVGLDKIENDIKFGNNLDKLYQLLSSVNGHTPKIVVDVSKDGKEIYETKEGDFFDEWIIKLPSASSRPKDGLAEYVYFKMAKAAGINVPEFNLFESEKCAGYCGVKRFDRDKGNKIHTLSVGTLANKYYLKNNIDIMDYIRVMQQIDPENMKDLLKILIFYIKTGNSDLRGTNVSFVLKNDQKWELAPAYDLVPFSLESIYTPKMLQKGYDKNEEDGKIYDLCELAEFDFTKVAALIDEVENAVSQYHKLML